MSDVPNLSNRLADAREIISNQSATIPWPPANSSEIPNSSWTDQPTEPGWYWYRREHSPDEIIRVIYNRSELLIEKIDFATFIPVGAVSAGQYKGQFQGPLKPVEGKEGV